MALNTEESRDSKGNDKSADSLHSDTNSRASEVVPLIKRSGARRVIELWETNRSQEVAALLTAKQALSARERIDAMLMDQRMRWQNAFECRAEVYVGMLKIADPQCSSEFIYELVLHELEMHRHFQPDTCPSIQETCRRFPALRNYFQGLDETITGDQISADQPSSNIPSDDPTRMVKSNDDPTATLELTDRLQHTNIGIKRNDDDATVLEIDGCDSQLGSDEFVSEQEKEIRVRCLSPVRPTPRIIGAIAGRKHDFRDV